LFFFSRWNVIDSNASDANIGYRPLFADTTAEPGESYSYRIRAQNHSEISEPSEIIGPVKTSYRLLIDEFENSRRMVDKTSGIEFLSDRNASRAKEDRNLLAGKSSDYIMYRLPKRITKIQLDAFFTTENRDSNVTFSSGSSSAAMLSLSATRQLFEPYKNEYKAYCPVRYSIENIAVEHRYIKINSMDDTQLGQLEIQYETEQ
jgi:hypothetical protein